MKIGSRLRGKSFLAAATAFSIFMSTAVYAAPSYKDVPSSHWAYASVSAMADAGIIVGDSSGNYNPNALVDKFAAAKMFARMAGFKYVSLSAEEELYQNRAYEANKATLTLFKNSFTRWDSSADKEIAFLMEKEILTVEDLNQFVIKMTDGTERIRALSRQEAAVFLVRLLERKGEAVNVTITALFDDDSAINASSRNSVYYLREIGVISGDANNNFNPNAGVTRASMAVLLHNAMNVKNGGATGTTTPGNSGTTTIESVSGEIKTIYSGARALEVEMSGRSRNTIVKVSTTASIYVDGFVKTFNDLQEGMTFTGVLTNEEFIEVRAIPANTSTTTTNPTDNPGDAAVTLTVVEGIVSGVETAAAAKTISVDVRILSPSGSVVNETRVYTLADGCTISRGSQTVALGDISVDEVVTVQVSGNSVYVIELAEKEIEIKGTLEEKRAPGDNNAKPILVVVDENKKEYEFVVTDDSVLSRDTSGNNIRYFELRLGDQVEVKAEYNNIIELHATGVRSTVEGTVAEIHILEEGSSIAFKNAANNKVETYPVIDSLVDIYTIRVGSQLRLRLESREVDSFSVLKESTIDTITGTINTIRSNYINISEGNSSASRQIYIDNDTVIFDATTGRTITTARMDTGMKVYITFENGTTLVAKTITVLSY